MARELQIDKWLKVSELKEGDKVKLTDGSIAYFVSMKRKNFSATIDGKSYSVPINMFVEVLEKAPKKELDKSYLNLKKGELFYIKHNNNALLFKFDEMKNGKIIGINIGTNGSTRIDASLYGGKVSDL